MKTFVPSKSILLFAVILTASTLTNNLFAQSGPGGGNDVLTNGLDFSQTPVLQTASNTNLKQGAVYLVKNVAPSVDAKIKIDSLVNGATVTKIDDNSTGLGYKQAFQPEVKMGSVIGKSYAVFTISFFKANTTTPEMMQTVNATALDIDGNLNLKEFADINVGTNGIAKFMSTNSDLSLLQILTGRFMGQNILGIERGGIDTASMANMFTASNSNVSSISFKFGALTVLPDQDTRQFSMYMKGFAYPNQVTLPVELISFDAVLNNNKKVDLKWTTASEKNVSHFAVEKSTDGQNYTTAGIVFAYGNTSVIENYSFSDNVSGNQTVIYYRLRSIDIDGKSQLSQIRLIRIAKEETIAVLTYPNPVTKDLRVTIPANWQGKKVSYELYNINGRMIIRNEAGSSSQTETMNVSSLSPGVYVMKVTCNGETASQQIVKQ